MKPIFRGTSLFVVLLSCFCAAALSAGPDDGSVLVTKGPAADPCKDPRTTIEMKECAAREYKEADAALNKAYKEAMARLTSKEQKDKLKEAQKAWIKFRDLHCESEYLTWEGGSFGGVAHTNCMTSLTRKRTAQLESLGNPEGGE